MEIEKYAPIALFVYKRPNHTKSVIEALLKNKEAKDSILYVFADGAKNSALKSELESIEEVRKIISKIEGFKQVIITERESNFGLKNNIISGISNVLEKFNSVIVLEDDIIPEIGFLKYMNDALFLYENEDKVMHISAFIYPIKTKIISDTFFYNVNSCWGWGTWKRAWVHFEDNPLKVFQKVNQNYNEFKFNGGQKNFFFKQLENNVNGTLKSWAVLWHSAIYLNNGLCLHPSKSLITNIGFDNSGENSGAGKLHGLDNITQKIKVEKLDIKRGEQSHLEISKLVMQNFNNNSNNNLKTLAKKFFKKLLKLKLFNSNEQIELNRIKVLPRYVKSRTTFLNKEIEFVDSTTYIYGINEIFKTNIYKFNASSNEPLIIDCGANIGLSVIYFKQLYPHAIIKAFEPDPKIFNTLTFNVNSFGFKEVELFQKAIWKQNETLQFKQEGGFSGRIPMANDEHNIIEVEAISLQEIIANKKIDFLKIDIEGAEYEVLKSCKDNLQNVEHIFIEYHSHQDEKQTLHEILEILTNQGFRYHILEAFTRKKPFIDNETMLGMDLQLNIFGTRK
jgi:hypothetical protein